jgi:predicted nucleotidyltransferase
MEEDLNLERNILKIVKYCWYNKRRFHTINDIANATKYTKKMLRRIAEKYDLPDRKTITIYDAPNQKSTEARS